MTCSNCGYEVNELVDRTEMCQTCTNAYDLNTPFTAPELNVIRVALLELLDQWQYDEGEGWEPVSEQEITDLLSKVTDEKANA